MAFVFKNFLKGLVGTVILKVVRGKQVVTAKRGKGSVKQTKNSIRSATTFGMASALAGQIRKRFLTWNTGFSDEDMVNRMNRLLIGILNDCQDPDTKRYSFHQNSFELLNGLNFNIKSALQKSLGVVPKVNFQDGILTITAGEDNSPFRIKYRKESLLCDLTMVVAIFDLNGNRVAFKSLIQRKTLHKPDTDRESLKFTFDVPGGCLCVASMFMRFFGSRAGRDLPFTDKNFSPSGICAAIYTPEYTKEEVKIDWRGMSIPAFMIDK